MAERSVMMVTDVFPPVAAVGVYRTVALCRHLVAHGRAVTVITARHWAGEPLDPELAALVPQEVRVVAAASPDLPLLAARLLKRRPRPDRQGAGVDRPQSPPAFRAKSPSRQAIDWLSWWLHVPDARTGWLAPAAIAGLRAARHSSPAVVYCTGPGWSSHLVGLCLSCLLRVPLVADFQDPWCGSYWRRMPWGAHRRLDDALERLVVRRAAQITCAWDGIRRHLELRYPKRRGDIRTVLNGFFPDEAAGIEPSRLDGQRCVLLHAGTFYGPRSPEPLLAALRQLRRESPDAARDVLVALVGRCEYAGRPLQELVEAHGVADLVTLVPPVSRRRALALIGGANAALLFGQSGDEALASVPAKTYDYLACGLPVLAIGCGAEVCRIVRDSGCRLWQAKADDPPAICRALGEIVQAHRDCRLTPSRDERRLAFAWPASAARLAEIVSMAAERAGKP